MSIVTWPQALPVRTQSFGVKNYDITFGAGASGGSQTKVGAPRRMTCSITSEESIELAEAAAWRSVVLALNGKVNLLAVYDIQEPTPRGTVRGALTVAQAAPAGALQITISAGLNQAGRTLLQGDWLGVHQASSSVAHQRLHVQEDAAVTATGEIAVKLGVALRVALPVGSAIAWDRPTCLMRQTGEANSWTAQKSRKGGFAIELLEDWE